MLVGLLLSLNALLLCLRKDGDALDVYQQFTVCIDAGHGGVDGGSYRRQYGSQGKRPQSFRFAAFEGAV